MIGNKILERRKELGLSQEQLVKKAKELILLEGYDIRAFNQAQLSRWESNEIKPNDSNLYLLSQLLNCTPDYFTGEKKENMHKKFYDEAVRLTRLESDALNSVPDKELENKLKTTTAYVLEAIKKENLQETIDLFIRLILLTGKSCSTEISIAIPQVLAGDLSESDFYKYMLSFLAGLNNSFYYRSKEELYIK